MSTFPVMDFKELGGQDDSEEEAEGLDSVKALTEKLKLQTRRPSYFEWKERLQSSPWTDAHEEVRAAKAQPQDENALKSVKESEAVRNICGFETMDDALLWLRKELRAMQLQDNRLARQLIHLRAEIHRLKVEQVCHRHKEMLDDATLELAECGEEPESLSDIPLKAAFALSTPLKHLGVTKMNINSRRFSLC